MTVLQSYHELERVQLPQGAIYIKPGMRGYPDPPAAERVFRRALASGGESLVDATGTAGAVALVALAAGSVTAESQGGREGGAAMVLEASMAALRCARQTMVGGAEVRPGLPWDLPAAGAQRVALAPAGDRGNQRIMAELSASRRALDPGGSLYVALHKEQGAKRFEKILTELFESTEVIERDRGWRLSLARGPLAGEDRVPWIGFEAAGFHLEVLPGVHAAGRLDPGSALLIEKVPWAQLAGERVLDLGCGFGILALLAARAGARVTAVDDDLAAVESSRRNASTSDLELDVRHSDVDSALAEERFDFILCNPPFHVGRGVRLDVPRAFIWAARRLLNPGGELWLVANRDLPYERELEGWSESETVTAERGFKVLRARR